MFIKISYNKYVELVEKWIRIDNVEYDVTQFIHKHPGGSVIEYNLASEGADATHAFNAFHFRSKKARKVLVSLPRREPILKLQTGGHHIQAC